MKRHIALLSWTVAVGLALGVAVTPTGAQQPAKVPRVGYLGNSATAPATEGFRQGLRGLGYVEGENIIVEYRFNEGRADRLPGLAAELVELGPDIIVAAGAIHAQALQAATTTIPVVFAINPDAVEAGLVADNARPGGNLTGFTSFDPRQTRKQLELLKEINPGLTRVAMFADQDVADLLRGGLLLGREEPEAGALGLELQGIGLQTANLDLEGAFEAARRERAEALLVLSGPVNNLNRKAIAELAITHRLPALFPADYVDDDWRGLVAYGTSLREAARLVPSYMDRILQGAAPGDLPVESLTHQTLIVNLQTAREIGVTIPSAVLERADQVISPP